MAAVKKRHLSVVTDGPATAPPSPKTCYACAFAGMEPDSPYLICGHKDAGSMGLYVKSEPLDHCGWKKFEQHPGRNPDGSLKPI